MDYNPADIARDATKFARSKFGKHYLEKLEAIRLDYANKACDRRYSREDRADFGLLAAETADHIGYFQTARTILANPSLLDKLRNNYKKRKGNAYVE